MTYPQEHLEEAQKLEMDAEVDLFELRPRNTGLIVPFRTGPNVVWQETEYANLPCTLENEELTTTQDNRPKFTFYNKDGVFSKIAKDGLLDLAALTRKKVLRNHLEEDINIFKQKTWMVGRIVRMNKTFIQVELKSLLDFPTMKTSARLYSPPEFPVAAL